MSGGNLNVNTQGLTQGNLPPPPPMTPSQALGLNLSRTTLKPKSPKMGGVKEVDTEKHMAWTGGKLLFDWSGLE